MDWKWIWSYLTAPPLYPLYLGISVGVVTVLGMTLNGLMKKRRTSKNSPPKAPDVVFLEGALEDDAPRKPNADYSYAEFQRDLHDKGLTFEEIYEKCGGVFPKKPGENPPLEGFQGPQGYIDFSKLGRPGVSGFSGYSGYAGQSGFSGYGQEGGRCPERMKELQEWFKERGKTSHVGGVVPPPPNPYPIVHKIYIRGRR